MGLSQRGELNDTDLEVQKCGHTFVLDAHEMNPEGSPLHQCNVYNQHNQYFFCSRVGNVLEEKELVKTDVPNVVLQVGK